jgi:hypothetical protein
VVALEASRPAEQTPPRRGQRQRGWLIGTAIVLLAGVLMRVAIGSGGVGDRSAAVMAVLLGVVVWTATLLLRSPRMAFFSTLGLMVLIDLAALPARNAPEFDDRAAFFRTDQTIAARVAVPPSGAAMLTVLAEPVFSGAQPSFGLAGQVGQATFTWDCAFQHGMQRLILPVSQIAAGTVDVALHLTGSPSRESDYLLVYASSQQGGLLIDLRGASDVPPRATRCTLR